MIRSALLLRRCTRGLDAPRRVRFKRGSTPSTSGLGPGPNKAAATLHNVFHEAQFSTNHQSKEKTPVALSCVQGCLLAKGGLRANTPENFHLEPLTVEDYHVLIETGRLDDRRLELLTGFLVAMPPQSFEHKDTANVLYRKLCKALEIKNRAAVFKADPICLSRTNSEPEPDVFIASGFSEDYDNHKAIPSDILLIAEVSKSTIVRDSTTKLETYALEGIPEYWIVNVEERNVQVLRKPRGNYYESRETLSSGFIAPAAFSDVRISVKDLFRP